MFLFKMPLYYKYLDEPVINFVSELNSLDDDLVDQTTGANT